MLSSCSPVHVEERLGECLQVAPQVGGGHHALGRDPQVLHGGGRAVERHETAHLGRVQGPVRDAHAGNALQVLELAVQHLQGQ
eukprot:8394007-Pyramimonas_sp.AAC.1